MMDKIVVTAADIEKLLAWRDEHTLSLIHI